MENDQLDKDRILFSQLVITFYESAWQSLGKVMNPITGKVERNLEAARNHIDILDMLKRRTAGNLSQDETGFLGNALYQLRMNYVEEVNADTQAQADSETGTDNGEKAAEVKEEDSPDGAAEDKPEKAARTGPSKGGKGTGRKKKKKS